MALPHSTLRGNCITPYIHTRTAGGLLIVIIVMELLNQAALFGTAKMAIELYEGKTFDERELNRIDKTLYVLVQVPYIVGIALGIAGILAQAQTIFKTFNLDELSLQQLSKIYESSGGNLIYFEMATLFYMGSWQVEKARLLYTLFKSLTPEERAFYAKGFSQYIEKVFKRLKSTTSNNL